MNKSTNIIVDECNRIQGYVYSLNEKFSGPLQNDSIKCTRNPFVLLLGNHSSGKSSFINYLLQRPVQMTGVAPTDDGFTVIGSGNEDIDRDGPSFIGDTNFGFHGLQKFGPMLIHRTQLKIRSNLSLQNVVLVDSPGMIDSSVMRDSNGADTSRKYDRGYDFEAVCRWFAERADVILLFFDPDKPGTTGETLSILTNSLSGLEHKLHIVLNKADQLKNIHDFARAYGALCWNLSKVILRKDLPKIHTICLPSPHLNQPDKLEISTSIKPTNNDAVDKSADEISDTDQIETSDSLNTSSWSDVGEKEGDINRFSDIASPVEGLPVSVTVPTLPTNDFMHQFLDLDSARVEVVREVVNAPNRRVDHEISRLTECAQLLIMHCKVLDCVSGEFFRSRLQLGSACFLAIGSCAALALQRVGLLLHSGFGLGLGSSNTLLKHSSTSSSTGKNNDLLAHLGVICVSTSAALGAYWLTEKLLHANALSLMSSSHLNEVYQAVYGQDIRDKNELVESLWRRVRSHLAVDSKLSSSRSAVSQIVNFLSTTPRVKQVELQSLQTILDKDVPHLRTQALTSHTKY